MVHAQQSNLRGLVKQPWFLKVVDDCVVLWARRGEEGRQGDEVLSGLEDARREEVLRSSQRGICECSGAVCSDGTFGLLLLVSVPSPRPGWRGIRGGLG